MQTNTNTNPLRRNQLADLPMEASPAAIVLTDSLGMIEAMNHVAEEWFGYEETDLLGQSIDVIFPDADSSDDASHQACILSQLGEPDPARILLLEGHRNDGSTLSVQVTLHSLITATGESRLAKVIDVSQETQRQEERIQGERLAAVLQMVSGLGHESRNALQRAQSCLDLLQLDLADRSDLLDLTEHISDALKDLHRNYEEVKNYASPITLKKTNVNLAKLCQSTFDELVESLGSNAPRLTIQCDAACESVKLDAARIGEVLKHVLKNAIHASPPDSVIDFHCDCLHSADASNIQIRVRDQGGGLTAEVEARMFEPFFTTKLKGTGLGLAVCRRIIEAHDGTIDAESRSRVGTLVRIGLPQDLRGK